jgi:hypothetical protein
LPKTLINAVPIVVQTEQRLEVPDLVPVDDDLMTHQIWKMEGKQHGLKVMTAFEERDVDWSSLSLSTPIYVYYRLKNGASGVQVAERLHELGFTNLFLTTGEAKQKFSGILFLKGVVGKGFFAKFSKDC